MDSIHIKDLPPPGIQHHIWPRTNLNPRCGRDITHLIDKETGEEVGGIVYNGLSASSLSILQNHHDHFKASADNLKRGNAFQKLDYGKMAAAGFCLPQGGAVGGGYGNSYKLSHVQFEATSHKDIADRYVGNLFKIAMVCGLLFLPSSALVITTLGQWLSDTSDQSSSQGGC